MADCAFKLLKDGSIIVGTRAPVDALLKIHKCTRFA